MSALLFFVGLLACQTEQPACVDNANCDEGEACVENECVVAECLESSQCDIGQFCDPVRFTCRDGCERDTDCLSGQRCDRELLACVDAGCRSTELDCPVGELCDSVTGSCYEPTPPVCNNTCDVGAFSDSCPGQTSCQVSATAETCNRDADCEAGWFCDLFTDNNRYCHKDYCMPACQPQAEDPGCPAGFSCYEDGFNSGVCLADCVWLLEGGYL